MQQLETGQVFHLPEYGDNSSLRGSSKAESLTDVDRYPPHLYENRATVEIAPGLFFTPGKAVNPTDNAAKLQKAFDVLSSQYRGAEQTPPNDTEMQKLGKRADTLSYRAFSENWNKTDRQTVTELLAKLLAEAGELAGAIETYYGRSLRPELVAGNFDEVEGEIGDVLTVMLRICSVFAADPETAVAKTLDKFEKRLERIGK